MEPVKTKATLSAFSDDELLEEIVRRRNGDDEGSRADWRLRND